MKHFEDLWLEAEKLASEVFSSEDQALKDIDFNNPNKEKFLGEILFKICYLSNKYNINVYKSLSKEMQEQKEKLMEPDEPS